ncbi:BTB/POZ domain-containing protein 3 [Nilaparvata lugens]|uniref:BTB/POZ domain-containing protein 3 n=1 Tax=Nilaparvata lugens TaxID=108931 RepID=UPI00193DA1CD|nr:BTB/POZ domain-containing protein 3 [Nilaparvata lugens]
MSSSSLTAKFKDRFLEASDNGFTYDCKFIVGSENKVIEGHKMFFSLASEVFKAMFYGDLKEDNVVKIEDLDADGFEAMKYFIYTGEVNFSSTIQALLTYIAARKYLISQLTKQCIVYIEQNIKPSEVLEVYEYCETNNIPGFDDLCLKIIEEETDQIVESGYFPTAKSETIQLILKSRRLTLESEIQVFKLFEKWALAKASRENISDEKLATSFGSLKKYIRFLTISKEEFTSQDVEHSLLLTQKEKEAIQSNLLLGSDLKPMPESLSVVQRQRSEKVPKRPFLVLK